MPPSVGRIVHYLSRGSADGAFPPACRAAVVVECNEGPLQFGEITLCVLNPSGIFFDEGVPHDETQRPDGIGAPGTWHWPERVAVE